MTLIVVDEAQMVADSYARVATGINGKFRVEEGFHKVFSLPFQIWDGTEMLYPRVAFAGCARSFYAFITHLIRYAKGRSVIELAELERVDGVAITAPFLLVLPGKGRVVTIQYSFPSRPNQKPVIEHHRGACLVFGGDYAPPQGGLEYRSWRQIFVDAYKRGLLPGGRYYALPHSESTEHYPPTQGEVALPL